MTAETYPEIMPSFTPALLAAMGLETTPWRAEFIAEWARCEGCKAIHNPLATTRWGRDDGDELEVFNSHNVRQFVTLKDGVEATIDTLYNGRYPSIVQAIRDQRFSSRGQFGSEMRVWGTMAFALEVENGWNPDAASEPAPTPDAPPPSLSIDERVAELVAGLDLVRRDGELATYRIEQHGDALTADDGRVFSFTEMLARWHTLAERIDTLTARVDALERASD